METRTGRGRARAVLLAAVLTGFALLAGACGSSGDGSKDVATAPSAAVTQPSNGSGSGSGSDGGQRPSDKQIYDGLLKYSKCMRSKGVANFPDPVLGKGLQVNGNEVGQDTATYKSADTACKALLPAGGGGDNAPQDRAAALKYSQCMRDNGVAKFPDPNPNGGMNLDGDKIGMTPDNPVFQAAQKKCEQFLGAGGSQGKGG